MAKRQSCSPFPASGGRGIELTVFRISGGSFRMTELGPGFLSEVEAGENSGRRMKHDFLVLDWADIGGLDFLEDVDREGRSTCGRGLD